MPHQKDLIKGVLRLLRLTRKDAFQYNAVESLYLESGGC